MAISMKALYRQTEIYLNQQVVVNGWIKTIRGSKSFGFIELNDGTFFRNLQIVFAAELPNYQTIAKLPIYSALRVEGLLIQSAQAQQGFELQAERIEIESVCAADYPLQKKRHTFEYLRTLAHLRPRTNTFAAVFRVRSALALAIHQFFQERGFVYVQTPIITASDAEGAGEMFQVTTLDGSQARRDADGQIDYAQDFFGRKAHLTVSGQLNAEAYALAFQNVYTFGPAFRAENSNTPRHAAEFWMVEPEMAFADLRDDMALAEDLLKSLVRYLLEHYPEEMEFFNAFIDQGLLARLENIAAAEFGQITYSEAIDILLERKEAFEYPVAWGRDLQTEHERYLTEQVFKKPVFVTDYPQEIKAFYMRLNDDRRTVAAMDLLAPGVGEIIGGSQREERLDHLAARMKELGVREEEYAWYLDLRRYGGVKHAGFGLGFERALMYLTGMANIRDVIPFPRTVNSIYF